MSLKARRVLLSGFRACVILLGVIALTACRRTTSTAPAGSSTPRALTFNRDIAPILFQNCGSCHRPVDSGATPSTTAATQSGAGDPLCIAGAPFSVLDYRQVRDYANEIADATESRSMPPWLPEPGFGNFANTRLLKDEQIALIRQWVDQGAPEGNPADKPPIPNWPSGWQLGTPDLVVKMPQPYTVRSGGSDVFRNFVLPVPLSSTRYVRAVEFRADSPRILHHASIAVDRTRFSRKLDRADMEPGFAAMLDDQVQNVYGWSPGKVPFMEPADMAWTLDKGSDLVVQLHMLPGTKPEIVQPSIGLFFADAPPARAPIVVKLESKSIDIPAGTADYVVEDSYVLPADVDVLSVYPHAHFLAKEMKGTATLPGGTTEWLIWVKHWDFRWQDQYRFARPLFLPKGTTLSMRFTYDNSDGNPRNPHRPAQRVKWGPQSSDEMGALWLDVLPRRGEDTDVLLRDFAQRSLQADIAGAETQLKTSPDDALAHNFLATKYLQAGRMLQAESQLQETLRLKPYDAEAHSNLGSALLQQGRVPEALEHLLEAARIKPGDDRVRFNLGNGLNAAGRTDEAIAEFQRAVRLNPENADAHFNLAVLIGPRNRLDDAIAHLRRAIEINPQYGDAHRNLAVALGLQGKVDAAIEEVRTALRIQPDSIEARRHLAQLLKAKGRATP
jgi:tetratricopeptide (TPR) repeat protein